MCLSVCLHACECRGLGGQRELRSPWNWIYGMLVPHPGVLGIYDCVGMEPGSATGESGVLNIQVLSPVPSKGL